MTNLITTPLTKQRAIENRAAPDALRFNPLLHCSYDEFLRMLAQLHGEEYLLRPDGEALRPRRPENIKG